MLGKLIKHEIKMTSRTFLPIYALALLLAPIERISVHALNTGFARELESPWKTVAATVFFFISLAYALSMMAAGFASLFLIINRFYKSMTTNEGYLTHTLPVKTSELIWSKAITAIFWTMISFIVIAIAAIILTFDAEGWKELFSFITEMNSDFINTCSAAINVPLVILELILATLVNGLFFIFTVYASIAIGQLFSKHKVACAIVAYFLIDAAIQLITGLITIPVAENISFSELADLVNFGTNQFIPYSIAFTGVLSAVLYFVTWYIFKNKLNLE